MPEPTFWNGEPCEAARGTGVVADAPFPLYWARELIGQRVPVVQVTYGEQRFTLYDANGDGWWKVTQGKGSPRWAHKNLSIVDFEAASGGSR